MSKRFKPIDFARLALWLCITMLGSWPLTGISDIVLIWPEQNSTPRAYAETISNATAILSIDPNDVDAYIRRAVAYLRQDAYREGLRDLDKAIQLDSTNALALRYRGMAYAGLREFDKAISDLDASIRLNPNDPLTLVNRGYVLGEQGALDRAIADHTRAIELEPRAPMIFAGRGTIYFKDGRFDLAVSDYLQSIRMDPNNARVHEWLGEAYAGSNDFKLAIVSFSKAIQINSNYALPLWNRGAAYFAIGNSNLAMADIQSYVRIESNDARARIALSDHHLNHQRFQEAISNASIAIRTEPTNSLALAIRAYAFESVSDYPKAISDYVEAVRWAPTNAQFHNGLAWILATCPDASYRNGTNAVASATRACELTEWKDGGYIDTLAAACAEKGDFDLAVEYQKRAMGLQKGDANERKEMQERLELYSVRKPYHAPLKNRGLNR